MQHAALIACESNQPMTLTSPSGTKKKVVVVEDHPLFRAMLVQLIDQDLGMTVCGETDNIKQAMVLIEQLAPSIVILDLTLQGSSGLESIKNLKAQRIRVPVLVLSMHDEKLYAERVLRAGARGYITKQEAAAKVIEAIRTVMDGRIYVSDRVSEEILGKILDPEKPANPSGVCSLTDREIEVFQLIGKGLNASEIARRLDLGQTTVDSYRARIKAKLGIKTIAELYQRAVQWVAEGGV